LEKYYPPPRTGIRAYVQPFEHATRPALQGVTFEVQEGEAVALLGANGAGKSTILRILAMLLIPTRGEGSESGPAQTRLPRRKRSGLLSTAYRAAKSFVLRPAQSLNARAQNRIAELGEKFHLTDALDQQVRTLSSGTTPRLSLARAWLPKLSDMLGTRTKKLAIIFAAGFRCSLIQIRISFSWW